MALQRRALAACVRVWEHAREAPLAGPIVPVRSLARLTRTKEPRQIRALAVQCGNTAPNALRRPLAVRALHQASQQGPEGPARDEAPHVEEAQAAPASETDPAQAGSSLGAASDASSPGAEGVGEEAHGPEQERKSRREIWKEYLIGFDLTRVSPAKAVELLRACSQLGPRPRGFDETIELTVELSLDPRKPNQSIRASFDLPEPHNRKRGRVVVVATAPASQEEARAAGADIIGGEELVAKIAKKQVRLRKSDRFLVSHADVNLTRKLARVLGPRGLMPNVKIGTVTDDFASAVPRARHHLVHLKTDKFGIVRLGFAMMSQPDEVVLKNFRASMMAIVDFKPSAAKGKYIKQVYVSSSMGPSVPVAKVYADPSSALFMRSE